MPLAHVAPRDQMKRRSFLIGAGALTAAPVFHALNDATASAEEGRVVRDPAAADGWHADYSLACGRTGAPSRTIDDLGDTRGTLPTCGQPVLFNPDAFGGLRGCAGGYLHCPAEGVYPPMTELRNLRQGKVLPVERLRLGPYGLDQA